MHLIRSATVLLLALACALVAKPAAAACTPPLYLLPTGAGATFQCSDMQEFAGSGTGQIPYANANDQPAFDAGFFFDPVTGTTHSRGGFVTPPNTADDTNGISMPTNEVTGGTQQSCATAGWHGNNASLGADEISIGDLGAGPGAVQIETCVDNAPAATVKVARFGVSSMAAVSAHRCLSLALTTPYDPTAALTMKNAVLINPNRPLRLRHITMLVAALTGIAPTEKLYFDVFTGPGDVPPTAGLPEWTYLARITGEIDGNAGTVTDATDEKGGAVLDLDAYPLIAKELNVVVDLLTVDGTTLHVCAAESDPDWTAEGGTDATPDVNIELEYVN